MTALCRNRKHPAEDRETQPSGRTYCRSCRLDERAHRHATAPGGRDGWSAPGHDAERARRHAAWADGLDAAIARIRLHEGFDGHVIWQTLGEYLRPEPGLRRRQTATPIPAQPRTRRPWLSQRSPRRARFQDAARREIGWLSNEP